MNTAILQVIIALISQIVQVVLPKLASADTVVLVTNIISALEKLMPEIIAAGEELTTTVSNIIAALRGAPITDAQWAALDAFEAKIDAKFDEAAKEAGV